MEDCATSTFLGSQLLVAPYLFSMFCIFDRLVLKEYVSQVERGPHFLQSCFHPTWDNLILVTKKMHPSFESLVVMGTLNLSASLMDIHHNTSLKCILEDGSIFFIIQNSHLLLFGQGGGVMVDCQVIYPFIPHCTLYFHLNVVFLFQFDLTFSIQFFHV